MSLLWDTGHKWVNDEQIGYYLLAIFIDLYSLEKHNKRNNCCSTLQQLMAGLVLGADGGVGSTYNFFPKMIQRIMKNVSDGKINEARAEQLHVQQFARARNKFSKW